MRTAKRIEDLALSNWLYLVALLIVLLPPYGSSGFEFEISRIPSLNASILTNSIKPDFASIFPAFNILALVSMFAIYTFGNRLARPFAIYAALTYILSAILQNILISDQGVVGLASSSFMMTLLAAAAWIWEAIFTQNDFSHRPSMRRLAILVPVSLLALWFPVNNTDFSPDFHLSHLLTSGSALTFCMMTIVFMSILLAYFPGVNPLTLRVTSLIGLLIGIGNLWLEFIYLPRLWWVGILHIPLVVLCALGLVLSLKHQVHSDKEKSLLVRNHIKT